MKKTLLFLLPLAAIALTGCPGQDGKGGDTSGEDTPKVLTLTKDVVLANAEFESENKTYPTGAFTFSVQEVEFSGTDGVGRAMPQTGEGATSGYNELAAMQLKKNAAKIYNTSEFAAKKVTVNWLATYASEANTYWPKVYAGSTPNPTGQITANEASPLTGTSTGKTQHVTPTSGDPFEADVYSYVSTFTIPEGSNYIAVGDSGGATYVTSIVIE